MNPIGTADQAGGGIELAVSTVVFALRPHPETGLMTLWLPLVPRIREPQLGSWALPGGPLRADEDLESSARRTLRATTSVEPRHIEQLYAFGGLSRSPQHRVVSIVYWVLAHAEEAAQVLDGENVRWFVADDLPALAFDHAAIIDYALWRLRNKLEYAQLAHGFLGGEFTMAQLREVHEAVLARALDPANFRRQMIAARTIEPTGTTVPGTSHRPPRLYRFRTQQSRSEPTLTARPADAAPAVATEKS